MSILRFENVSYSYPGAAAPALRGVGLAIEPGEFCVVAGLSGSGKSTLLRAACGLVPHFHGGSFGGTVLTAGLDTREHTPAEIGAHAGTLLPDPETQVVMASVRAEIAFALENRGLSAGAVARSVEETALALGIADLLDRSTQELSGGELQRVALAGALAAGPELVLLDEPTSQLDPVAGDELIWQLRRLNQESDTAVLLIEQRLERCLAAADRVIAMSAGRSSATVTRPASWRGRPSTSPPCRPRAHACSRAPVWARRRAASSRPARSSGAKGCWTMRRGGRRGPSRQRGGGARKRWARRRGRSRPGKRRIACPRTRRASLCPSPSWRRLSQDRPRAAAARGVARAARRPGDPARRRPAPGRRRGGGADGAQRRRQVNAAAPRRGADGAHPRARAAARRAGVAAAEPGRPVRARARPRRGSRRGTARARPRGSGGAQPPRPLLRAAPAPGARGRARGPGEHADGDRPRRAHQGNGPRRQAALGRVALGAGTGGGARAGGHPRLRVRRRIRHPRGAAGARAGDRRRADQRGARRRALLHHRSGPDPRWRRRRRARRAGGGLCGSAPRPGEHAVAGAASPRGRGR